MTEGLFTMITKRFLALLMALTIALSVSTSAYALDIPGRGKGEIESIHYDLWGDELTGVLDSYRQILDPIRTKAEKTWYADFCYGVLKDIDNDGYPEMLLLYSPDGNDLEAVIACRTGKGKVEGCKYHICVMAGGAGGGIAVGDYQGMKVIHVIYQNNTKGGTCKVVWDDVFNIAGGIGVYTTAASSEDEYNGINQYEVNGRSDASGYRTIMNGITVRFGGPGRDGAKSLSDLASAIENYGSTLPAGRTVCSRCGGTGRCPFCGGIGGEYNYKFEWEDCPFCVFGDCFLCNGSGYTN